MIDRVVAVSRRTARVVTRSTVARTLATILAVILLVHSTDLSKAAYAIRDARMAWIILGVLLSALSVVGGALQWGVLIPGVGHRPRWRALFSWHLQALFVGQILPTGLGGDALRAIELGRVVGRAEALASLAGSRMAGAMGMALWGVVGAVVLRAWVGVPGIAAAILFAIAMVVAWIAALLGDRLFGRRSAAASSTWRQRLCARFRCFASAFVAYRRRPWALVQTLSLGAASWGVNIGALAAFARAVDVEVAWILFAVAIPLTLVATLLPFSINGIGVREGLLVHLLSQAGVNTAHAGALSVLVDVQAVPFVLLGAVFWMRRHRRSCRAADQFGLGQSLPGTGRGGDTRLPSIVSPRAFSSSCRAR